MCATNSEGTHHYACECREEKFKALLKAAEEIMRYKTDGGSGMCGGSQLYKVWEKLEKAIEGAKS